MISAMATVSGSSPGADPLREGWANGSRAPNAAAGQRRISCVLTTCNAAGTLRLMVPLLSEALTRSGHAWELIAVDAASIDESPTVLRSWCQLPGYRLIALDEPVPHQRAVRIGIEGARGDAVIVLDARVDQPLHVIGGMIQRRQLGHRMVYAVRDEATGRCDLYSIGVADGSARTGPPDPGASDRHAALALVDREFVRILLR